MHNRSAMAVEHIFTLPSYVRNACRQTVRVYYFLVQMLTCFSCLPAYLRTYLPT